MTETAIEGLGNAFPELGAKSPEKEKPKSAPRGNTRRTGGGGGRDNNKPRERAEPVDDGEPLIPPPVVKEPSQEEQDAIDAKFRAEIEKENERVTQLQELIEKTREDRGVVNEATKTIREELKAKRALSNECAQERDSLVDQLKKHSDGTKAMENDAARIRKGLKMSDAAQIDKAIKDMNEKLETSSMDLKSEKALVFEIQKLTAQKEQIKEYDAAKAKVESRKEAHEELYKKRTEVGEKLQKLREEEKEIVAKLDAAKTGDGTPDGVAPHTKLMDLMDQKTKTLEGIKVKRAAQKEASVAYRVKIAEYREYQKAVIAYERKVERREWQKRRVEQAERNEAWKAEKKQRDTQRKEERTKLEKRFAAVASGFQMFVGGLSIRATEAELLVHFSKFGQVLDCVIVKEIETKISRGFGFVTMAVKAEAEAAIKECNNIEDKKLCPAHGKMNIKFAEKSKQQKEWEEKQKEREARANTKEEKAAEEDKAADEEVKEEEKKESPKKEEKKEKKEKKGKKEKTEEKEADNDDAVAPDEAEADDFFAAFGGGSDKVELPPKEDAPKAEAPKDGEKKEWKATRTDWVAPGEGIAEGDAKEGGEE